MKNIIEIPALANVHWHGREGDIVGPLIERAFQGGADVLLPMPNTNTSLTTAELVMNYIATLKHSNPWPEKMRFLSTVMITENTTEKDIDECVENGIRDGKIYPRERTTKSKDGVRCYGRILPIIKHCGRVGMKVHLHPEHPSTLFSNRDAEFAFLPIAMMFVEETMAQIIWEHGSDARCIPFWKQMAVTNKFFVTLTAHHLATNEDETFGDVGATCKPPIKTENDRRELIKLIFENHNWVMAGGDDAFHDVSAKHLNTGRAACGAYTAPYLLPLYAHILEPLFRTDTGFMKDGFETFINFTSKNARRLHNLPESSRTVKLKRELWNIPSTYPIGSKTALPFWAGRTIGWKIVD